MSRGFASAVTADLVARLVAVDTHVMVGVQRLAAELPGNPLGVEVIETEDGATLFIERKFPDSPVYNRIAGLREATAASAAGKVRRLREAGVQPLAEIPPGAVGPDLAAALHREGLAHTDFASVYYAGIDEAFRLPMKTVRVRRATTDADMEVFADVHVGGWEVSEAMAPLVRAQVRRWREPAGWFPLIAEVEGRPAGCALLAVHDGIGCFANACTLKAYRGRGCQTALFAARVQIARRARCDYVFGATEFDSPSGRNMETFGLRPAFSVAIWTDISGRSAGSERRPGRNG